MTQYSDVVNAFVDAGIENVATDFARGAFPVFLDKQTNIWKKNNILIEFGEIFQ